MSVCLSVRLSVTHRFSIETVTHILKLFSQLGSHQTGWQYSDGDPLTGSSNAKGVWEIAIFDQYFALSRNWYKLWPQLLWNANRKPYTQAFELYHFQWPWTTPNLVFKVTPFFDAKNLRNGTRYIQSFNGMQRLTHALLNSVISSELEWLNLAKYSI